jgi:hypothetical protein
LTDKSHQGVTFPRNETYIAGEICPRFGLLFKFYFIFPMMFIRMETILVLASDFFVEEIAPVLCSEQ